VQLKDLVKPIDQCTDEELQQRLQSIRHNRTVVRQAGKDHVRRAARVGQQSRVKKVEDLLKGLTPEQIIELLGG
jgi:hypothetical protein